MYEDIYIHAHKHSDTFRCNLRKMENVQCSQDVG